MKPVDFSRNNRSGMTRDNGLDWSRSAASSVEKQAAAELTNCIKVGKSGSGKTTSGRADIQRDIGKKFLLVEDIHGSYSDAIIANNPRQEKDIEILDLNNPDRMFPVELLSWSSAPGGKGVQENEAAFDNWMALTVGGRNVDPLLMAMHGLGWRLGREIMTHRHEPAELADLYYLFREGRQHDQLLATTWDDRAAQEVAAIMAIKNQVQRLSMTGPFQRLTDPFLTSLFIQALLSRPGVSWRSWMEQKKCVIVRGTIDTPDTVYRPTMGMLRFLTVQTSMRYFAETGKPLFAQIHADESARLGIGSREAAYMAQCRKAGVGYTLYYQRYPRDEASKEVTANLQRLEIYQQANVEECEHLAREVVAFLFNSMNVKRRELRERAINRGSHRDEIKIKNPRFDKDGKKVGETESTQFISTPDIEMVTDEHVTFQQHNELVQDWVRIIRELDRTQRLVIDGAAVTKKPELVPLPEGRLNLTDNDRQRVREITDRIMQRDHYFTPDFSMIEPAHEINDEPEGEIEEWEPTPSSKPTGGFAMLEDEGIETF